MGPTYYQRLKHLVSDKINARDFGNVQSLTLQPTVGKSRGGAIRFGEMENSAAVVHGCSMFLKERLFIYSDKYSINVCGKCRNMIHKECGVCESDNIVKTDIPFACKLLFQDLMVWMKLQQQI